MTTSEPPEQNETADPGGPCSQLLMRKNVPIDGFPWLDTFTRRVEERDGTSKTYTTLDPVGH